MSDVSKKRGISNALGGGKRCQSCDKMRGFGDMVAKVTSAVGIKPCESCKKRQEYLNNLIPFGVTQDNQPPQS